jgi:hypothetical protein
MKSIITFDVLIKHRLPILVDKKARCGSMNDQ